MKFDVQLYMTSTVDHYMKQSERFADEVIKACRQFQACDWGDLTEDDKIENDHDFAIKEGHIIGKYDTCKGEIYIETSDFMTAMVMFTGER